MMSDAWMDEYVPDRCEKEFLTKSNSGLSTTNQLVCLWDPIGSLA